MINRSEKESGVALVWTAIFLVLFISIIALAIDMSRTVLTDRNLQQVSDVAALAATESLDGTEDGWNRAVEVAVRSLKSHNVFGVDDDSFSEDNYERTGSLGDVDYKIERGVYWKSGTEARNKDTDKEYKKSIFTFSSLEEDRFESDDPNIPKHNLPDNHIANAVKVTLDVGSYVMQLGGFLGVSEIKDLQSESVAAIPVEDHLPVAPFAIPACELLAETGGGKDYIEEHDDTPVYTLNHLDLSRQCGREVIMTIDAPYHNQSRGQVQDDGKELTPSYTNAILEGFLRYESYIKKDTARSVPVHGVMGIPADAVREGQDYLETLVDLFDSGNFVVPASIGDSFIPLSGAEAFESEGIFSEAASDGTIERMETAVASFINDGEVEMKSDCSCLQLEKYDPDYCEECIETPGRKCTNEERRLIWPYDSDYDENKSLWAVIVLPGLANDELRKNEDPSPEDCSPEKYEYTNPMCHYFDATQNPKQVAPFKAREVNIPLIARGKVDLDGNEVEEVQSFYCDFENQFEDDRQNRVPPVKDTEPVIVGFVKGYLYDFNIDKLTEEDLPNKVAGDRPAYEGTVFRDFVETMTDFVDSYEKYSGDYSGWQDDYAKYLKCEEAAAGCRERAAVCEENKNACSRQKQICNECLRDIEGCLSACETAEGLCDCASPETCEAASNKECDALCCDAPCCSTECTVDECVTCTECEKSWTPTPKIPSFSHKNYKKCIKNQTGKTFTNEAGEFGECSEGSVEFCPCLGPQEGVEDFLEADEDKLVDQLNHCFNTDGLAETISWLKGCRGELTSTECLSKWAKVGISCTKAGCVDIYDDISPLKNLEPRDDAFCLPQKENGCFPSSDSACWKDYGIVPMSPQFGCAGFRVKLACGGEVIEGITPENDRIINISPYARINPMLVPAKNAVKEEAEE